MTTPLQSKRTDVARRSLDTLSAWLDAGNFGSKIAVDRHSGDLLDAEARAAFAGLPAVSPATSLDELVQHGLIDAPPPGAANLWQEPRYVEGREVFLHTTLEPESPGKRGPVASHAPDGDPGITHRGVLRGRNGGRALIEAPGADNPLVVEMDDLLALNDPCGYPPNGGTLENVHVDYNDPLMKAHVCAGFMVLRRKLGTLDFQHQGPAQVENQRRLIHAVAARSEMYFPGRNEGYSGHRAAALFAGGVADDFRQRAVLSGYLGAFQRLLGFEQQMVIGRTLRLGAPHGFVVLTLRPTMRRFVCDPAWQEPLTDARVAFFDAAWGHDRQVVSLSGVRHESNRSEDIQLPTVELP